MSFSLFQLGLLMVLLVGLGVVALTLVSSDLARALRMGMAQRLALMAGLGLGVVALGIKVAVYTVLSLNPPNPVLGVRKAAESHSAVIAPPDAAWRALPQPVPDPAPSASLLARREWGRLLFFDTGLSKDGSVSCATCHELENGGDDGRSTAIGIKGLTGPRNTPSVWNSARFARLFLDGRAHSLQEQALGPLLNPVEMGLTDAHAIQTAALRKETYRHLALAAYGTEQPTAIQIAQAIAEYEEQLVLADTPYDRFVRGDRRALSRSAKRGMALFDRIGCRQCHMDPLFSAAQRDGGGGFLRPFPRNASSPYLRMYDLLQDKGAADPESSRAMWRVPSLRNARFTGPYFHNGSVDTLREAIKVMASTQLGRTVSDNPDILYRTDFTDSGKMIRTRTSALRESDITDLENFILSLSQPIPKMTKPGQ